MSEMKLSPELISLVRRAIHDPGSITPQIMSWPDMGGGISGRAVEPLEYWQARAVLLALYS